MADVTERSLALLAALQTGRAFTSGELARHLDVSPRTLRRDIDRLRGYGYPVEAQPGPGGYYRLATGNSMPPLLLDDDEAAATLLALAALAATGSAEHGSLDAAATRAYGKVDQYLPARLRPRVAALRASLDTDQTVAPSTSTETLRTLGTAIQRSHLVAFDYANARGTTSSRRVEPHRQVHLLHRWYLLAWDLGPDAWRVFRVDRISDARDAGRSFRPRPLPAGGGVEHVRQAVTRDRQRVVVTVEAPVATVADALRHQYTDLTPLDAHRTRIVLMLESWQWLVLHLALVDADFTIEEPASMREQCRRFGTRLAGGGRG
ncbi:helix-turn-helix transcriptional regulator [Actinoalloteichus spitiensis]|uniref:helix-turn-helix transcriptional regulator n=1 Tax=Actinoalloteichus spitiensis TaxID=252394 RepID=UPI0003793AFB|nr:WYL domain-containing protein [Actinoalloteichus spitiensis]